MFVDLHNHILPGIDDGAPTMADSLKMARMAVADGTDTMVASPHRAWGSRMDGPRGWVLEQVAQLQAELISARIALKVVPGLEIPIRVGVAADLKSRHLITLGDTNVSVLIEPPFNHIPKDALDNLLAIRDLGLQIVLAHPERNAEVQHHLAFVEACADLGIVFQLTTGSILGRFGSRAQKTVEAILRHHTEWSLIIASDSHDQTDRSPAMMRSARDAAALIVGDEAAHAMVDSRPRTLLGLDKPISSVASQ